MVWTASAGGGIKPGQFQQFFVSFDSLPDASSIEIKALQTYSNGDIVRWIDDPAPAGGDEPEHPAPILTLVAGDQESAAPTAPAPAATVAAVAAPSAGKGGDGGALTVGIIGLVLGLIGAVLGFAAYRRTATRTT